MLLSSAHWAARAREDRRPLYRRIFTNRRLDIVHKTAVRSIFGFLLFSCSYVIVNTGIYYQYVRPIRQEERERLERELIEADKVSRILSFISSRNDGLFLAGLSFGATFELVKINLDFSGVSFYKMFKQKQLAKELQNFEKQLQEHERLLSQAHVIQNSEKNGYAS